jgi:hypothetical protein
VRLREDDSAVILVLLGFVSDSGLCISVGQGIDERK